MCPDRELISKYADGSISSTNKKKIQKHLKRCNLCQEEYSNYLKMQGLIKEISLVPVSPCLSPSDFLQLFQGAEETQTEIWEDHLIQCKACREDYISLKEMEEVEEEIQISEVSLPLATLARLKELAPTVQESSSPMRVVSMKSHHRSSRKKPLPYKKRSHSLPVGWIVGIAASLLFLVTLIFVADQSNQNSTIAKGPAQKDLPDGGEETQNLTKSPQKPLVEGTSSPSDGNSQGGTKKDPLPGIHLKKRDPLSSETHKNPRETTPQKDPLKPLPVKTETKDPTPVKTLDRGPITIACLKGKIWLKKNKGSFNPTKEKSLILSPVDRIKVGTEGALLALGEGNLICAKKDTQLSFANQANGKAIELHRGTAFFAFERTGGLAPQVKTSQALCTVKGTEFQVEVRGTVTYLSVAYGEVEFQSHKTNERVSVKRGQKSWITSSQGPQVRTMKKDVDKVVGWTWKLRPSELVRYSFDHQGQDSVWRGWIVNDITYKNSLGALRAIVVEDNPYWGVRAYLDQGLFSFRAHQGHVIRLAYHINMPRAILIQIYNATQGTSFHYKLLKPKVGEWALLEFPLSAMKTYFKDNKKIAYGDSLGKIEVYSGTPKTKNQIRLIIDDFVINRKN